MEGVLKPFNPEVHAQSDKVSKIASIKLLRALGYDAFENPNKFGVDVCISLLELEHRTIWEGSQFPFNTVHIPARKEKFLKYSIKYGVLNKDLSYIMICDSSVIIKYAKKEVSNTAISEGEFFYDVPISEWSVICIQDVLASDKVVLPPLDPKQLVTVESVRTSDEFGKRAARTPGDSLIDLPTLKVNGEHNLLAKTSTI